MSPSVHRFTHSQARLFLEITLLAAALIHTGCSPRTSPDSHFATGLAEVNGTVITEEMFRRWWSKAPPATESLEAKQIVLDQLIRRARMAQRARTSGLDRDPAFLEAVDDLLIARLKAAELEPALKEASITEAEVRHYYEAFAASKFWIPERRHVAVLWFDSQGQAPLEMRYRARLEQARTELEAEAALASQPGVPTDFGRWAMTCSEHRASRFKGGDIGWVEASHSSSDPWRQAIWEIASILQQPGELSPVIIRSEGVFLVRLMEARPGRIREFEEVRSTIEKALLEQKRAEMREQFEQRIEQEGTVQIHVARLASLTGLPIREKAPPFAPSGPGSSVAQR